MARPMPGAPRPQKENRTPEPAGALHLVQLDGRGEQVDRLLDAVLAVGSGLDLQVVLRRIVEAALGLVDAQYGALGVVDASGLGLSQFITVGADAATVAAIGAPPTGHGVLGQLLRDPQPLLLRDLADHSASVGFPPGHPPMRSFLGVPVRVGDAVFGNLYLTEKRDGREFTTEDHRMVVALAAAAGIAVHNARLYDTSTRRGAWMEAGREVSTSLLSGTEREDVIALVVERARELLGADVALVAMTGRDGLQLEASSGEAVAVSAALAAPLAQVLAQGAPREVSAGGLVGTAVPLGPAGDTCQGVLAVLWVTRPERWVTAPLTGFAAQVAVVLELADRRGEAERSALVQDRDRIGRDLHDLVIQRLFAAGMQLQSAVRLVEQDPGEAKARVNRAVDELDGTIRELRSTIYGLQAPVEGRPSLRAQLLQVLDAATAQLGFAPSLRLDGLLDTLVGSEVAAHAVATLREALSNAARHAAASHVDVLVSVRDDVLRVEVTDDGVGTGPSAPRSGLVNLSERADLLGGRLSLEAGPRGGTRLRWQVPV